MVAQSFLEKLRWHEHQCIILPTDAPTHIFTLCLNMIHPERQDAVCNVASSGATLPSGEAYEQRARPRLFAEQRLLPAEVARSIAPATAGYGSFCSKACRLHRCG